MAKDPLSVLPVRTVRVAGSRGVFEINYAVPCPTHGSVPLARCEGCERMTAIQCGRDGEKSSVACRPAEPPKRGPALWQRTERQKAAPDRTRVYDIMTSDLTCVTSDLGLESVAALLLDARIGAVPVVDYEGFPVGILSKTDLVRDGFDTSLDATTDQSDTQQLTLRSCSRVFEVMKHPVRCVREDATIVEAATLMLSERLHHLPVVDAHGRLVGMLSTFDLARWIVYTHVR